MKKKNALVFCFGLLLFSTILVFASSTTLGPYDPDCTSSHGENWGRCVYQYFPGTATVESASCAIADEDQNCNGVRLPENEPIIP